jgi:hypothetical protein
MRLIPWLPGARFRGAKAGDLVSGARRAPLDVIPVEGRRIHLAAREYRS